MDQEIQERADQIFEDALRKTGAKDPTTSPTDPHIAGCFHNGGGSIVLAALSSSRDKTSARDRSISAIFW